MEPDFTLALSLALAITVVQVGTLRVIDVHEKEPVWALLLLVWLGAVSAAVAALVVSADTRTETVLGVALTSEIAKFAAIGAGLALLAITDRLRGWSQLNGIVDSLIYGAAAGFGFATGDAFLRETFASTAELQIPDRTTLLEVVWMALQSGLSQALFGAILGAGLGAAFLGRGGLQRCLYPLAALAVAVLAHLAFASAALEGFQVGPSESPVVVVAVLAVLVLATLLFIRELRVESGAIVAELEEERGSAVTAEELEMFRTPAKRRRAQARRFLAGDVEGLIYNRALENRQVQLALERRRARALRDPEERAKLDGELERLRAEIERERRVKRDRQARPAEGPAEAGGETGSGPARTTDPRRTTWHTKRTAGTLVATLLLAAGGMVIAIAAGAQPPTTTATRTALFERDQASLNEDATQSELRLAVRQVVGFWRLGAVDAHVEQLELGDQDVLEAYDISYTNADGDGVRFIIARYSSSSEAELVRDRLAAAADDDVERWVWTKGETLSMLTGERRDLRSFCAASPQVRDCYRAALDQKDQPADEVS